MDAWCAGIAMTTTERIGWAVCGHAGNKPDGGRTNIDKA